MSNESSYMYTLRKIENRMKLNLQISGVYVQIRCSSPRGKRKKTQPTVFVQIVLLSGCCLIAVDLLRTKRRPHSAESLKEVCVFNG